MSYTFVNKPRVTNDIEDIVDYYVSINPELATAFLDQIEIAKKIYCRFPRSISDKI